MDTDYVRGWIAENIKHKAKYLAFMIHTISAKLVVQF